MKSHKGLVLAMAVMALSLLVSAAPKTKKVSLTLYDNTSVAGTMLKPGDYQVVVDDTSVTFLRDGKEVAKSPAVMQEGPEKFGSTQMVTSDDHSLKEICLGGSNTRLVLK